jgi:hypothetical protein
MIGVRPAHRRKEKIPSLLSAPVEKRIKTRNLGGVGYLCQGLYYNPTDPIDRSLPSIC